MLRVTFRVLAVLTFLIVAPAAFAEIRHLDYYDNCDNAETPDDCMFWEPMAGSPAQTLKCRANICKICVPFRGCGEDLYSDGVCKCTTTPPIARNEPCTTEGSCTNIN